MEITECKCSLFNHIVSFGHEKADNDFVSIVIATAPGEEPKQEVTGLMLQDIVKMYQLAKTLYPETIAKIEKVSPE